MSDTKFSYIFDVASSATIITNGSNEDFWGFDAILNKHMIELAVQEIKHGRFIKSSEMQIRKLRLRERTDWAEIEEV